MKTYTYFPIERVGSQNVASQVPVQMTPQFLCLRVIFASIVESYISLIFGATISVNIKSLHLFLAPSSTSARFCISLESLYLWSAYKSFFTCVCSPSSFSQEQGSWYFSFFATTMSQFMFHVPSPHDSNIDMFLKYWWRKSKCIYQRLTIITMPSTHVTSAPSLFSATSILSVLTRRPQPLPSLPLPNNVALTSLPSTPLHRSFNSLPSSPT